MVGHIVLRSTGISPLPSPPPPTESPSSLASPPPPLVYSRNFGDSQRQVSMSAVESEVLRMSLHSTGSKGPRPSVDESGAFKSHSILGKLSRAMTRDEAPKDPDTSGTRKEDHRRTNTMDRNDLSVSLPPTNNNNNNKMFCFASAKPHFAHGQTRSHPCISLFLSLYSLQKSFAGSPQTRSSESTVRVWRAHPPPLVC